MEHADVDERGFDFSGLAWDEPSEETKRLVAARQESQDHESVEAAWRHLFPLLPFPGFVHKTSTVRS